jgi:hypothetical protein
MSHISLWIDSYKGGTATISNAASLDKDANHYRYSTTSPGRHIHQNSEANSNCNGHACYQDDRRSIRSISSGKVDVPSARCCQPKQIWSFC